MNFNKVFFLCCRKGSFVRFEDYRILKIDWGFLKWFKFFIFSDGEDYYFFFIFGMDRFILNLMGF